MSLGILVQKVLAIKNYMKESFLSSSIDIRKLWVTEMSQCRQLWSKSTRNMVVRFVSEYYYKISIGIILWLRPVMFCCYFSLNSKHLIRRSISILILCERWAVCSVCDIEYNKVFTFPLQRVYLRHPVLFYISIIHVLENLPISERL